MESTINQRISLIMDAQRMNLNNFSKALGKSYTAVHGIIKGGSKPGYDLLEAIIITFPEVNPAWLLTGEGEMNKKLSTPPVNGGESYLVEHLHTLEENFARLASQLESKDKQIEGLQRTVDALISRPATPAGNFSKPAISTGKIIPMPVSKKVALNVA